MNKKYVTINVAQKDIMNCIVDNGWLHNPISNAVARKQKLPLFSILCVHNNVYMFSKSTWDYKASLPTKAINFIRQFEDGNDVKPFKFKISWEKIQY